MRVRFYLLVSFLAIAASPSREYVNSARRDTVVLKMPRFFSVTKRHHRPLCQIERARASRSTTHMAQG
jgi:hypothetical protein